MPVKSLRRERSARTWGERAGTFGPAFLLSLLALIVTYRFAQPAPPRHIVFATAQEGGAYFLFGLGYQALLAREGIEVTVHPTSGPVENIRLLQTGEADVAFVQGGTGATVDAPGFLAWPLSGACLRDCATSGISRESRVGTRREAGRARSQGSWRESAGAAPKRR
jgi:hypothetical protein